MIALNIVEPTGTKRRLEIPEGISLSLMEVLKASDYAIPATCGGLALCATCHVEVIHGSEHLDAPGDSELDMIDLLPNAVTNSRLACQIPIKAQLDGAVFRLMEPSE